MKRRPRTIKPRLPIVPWDADMPFAGENVCVIGGGPSLIGFDIAPTQNFPCIVVNNSFRLAPWARALHFSDRSWWVWNREDVLANWPEDRIITTANPEREEIDHPRIKRFLKDRALTFSNDRRRLYGVDSGTQAVNLAYILGAKKIVLLGLDMKFGHQGRSHWHDPHPRASVEARYTAKFRPKLASLACALARYGVKVVRATDPGPVEIPYVTLETALGCTEHHHRVEYQLFG